jgi:hypothetical protein
MTSIATSPFRRGPSPKFRSACAAVAALGCLGFGCDALAAEKPPLAPDMVGPFSTDSRMSATVEFGLRNLASDIEADIPTRLASIDERVSCVQQISTPGIRYWKLTHQAHCQQTCLSFSLKEPSTRSFDQT